MPDRVYQNFDLLISRTGDTYLAKVAQSPAGEPSVTFTAPFSELDIQGFEGELKEARWHGAPGKAAVQGFGQALFDAVFTAGVRECLHRSLDIVAQSQQGLRLRLRLADVPELAAWPWEYLYDPVPGVHLALSAHTPVVRYMDMLDPIRPLPVEPPLSVLVMISDPSDQPRLAVENEWANITRALAELQSAGKVTVRRLDVATRDELRNALREGSYHILHFIGHGVFDQRTQDSILLLENEQGKSDPVTGDVFGTLLHDHTTLRLVVINACHGAAGSTAVAFVGVAQHLVRRGIRAVVAMQYEVSDAAAIVFSTAFYRAVADWQPVDAAVGDARIAMLGRPNEVEWGTPVLFLRAPDGQVFVTEEGEAMPGKADQPDREQGNKVSVTIGSVSGKVYTSGGDMRIEDHSTTIQTGDVSGTGIAIGPGAQTHVTQQQSGNTLFDQARMLLEQSDLPRPEKEDAQRYLKELQEQDMERPEQDRIDYYLDRLERIAPAVVELIINLFANPGAAVGKGLQLAIHTWRQARQR